MGYRRRRQRREKLQPAQAAAPVKKAAPSAADLVDQGQCPYCPKQVTDFKNARGFKTHMRYCAKKQGKK